VRSKKSNRIAEAAKILAWLVSHTTNFANASNPALLYIQVGQRFLFK